MGLGHLARLVHSKIREHAKRGTGVTHSIAQAITKEPPRSPEWSKIERREKELHPNCQACNSTKHVQIHHCESFKTHPDLELHDGTGIPPANAPNDPNPTDGKSNFISLCMDVNECHLKIGHGGSFQHGGYNPNVRDDAQAMARLVKGSMGGPLPVSAVSVIWLRAKAARVTE